ncbi:hypothetical protein OAL04_06475 [Nitrospinae bacterium]|nr:hypothetical protein [Nitrospinota bacterium]
MAKDILSEAIGIIRNDVGKTLDDTSLGEPYRDDHQFRFVTSGKKSFMELVRVIKRGVVRIIWERIIGKMYMSQFFRPPMKENVIN